MDISAALPVKTPPRLEAQRAATRDDPPSDDFAAELDSVSRKEEPTAKPEKARAAEGSDSAPEAKDAPAPEASATPDAVVPGVPTAAPTPISQAIAVASQGPAVPATPTAPPTSLVAAAPEPTFVGAIVPAAGAPTPSAATPPPSAGDTSAAAAGQHANTGVETLVALAAGSLQQMAMPQDATTAAKAPAKKAGEAKTESAATASAPALAAAPIPGQPVPPPPATGTATNGGGQDGSDSRGATGPQTAAAAQSATPTPQAFEFKLDASAAATAMQPASQPAQNAPAAAPALIAQNAPVFVPPEALGVAIARKALDGINKFELRLDPPEMGRLDVSLEVDDAGNVRAHVRAERPEALELLQREAKGMEQALRQAGLTLDQSSLTFSLNGRESRDAQAEQHQGRRAKFNAVLPEDEIHTAALRGSAPAKTGLDLRV
jgi:flagellar hook-length control protein FliK